MLVSRQVAFEPMCDNMNNYYVVLNLVPSKFLLMGLFCRCAVSMTTIKDISVETTGGS